MKSLTALVGPATLATARGALAGGWRRLFTGAGVYVPIPDAEKAVRLEKTIRFKGDKPVQIAGAQCVQGRMRFATPRPTMEETADLVVTPAGGGWRGGRLYERYSARSPGLRMLMENRRPAREAARGYVVQSAHIDTFGDWVSEYVSVLERARPLDAPLFLPARLAAASYARRDLAALGVAVEAVGRPVLIRRAAVLRQQKYFVHFPPEEAEALRRFWGEGPDAAQPRSVVYLSRLGERSAVADRAYPSAAVEAMVRARGGRVIRTAEAAMEDYAAAAAQGETVVFDHGSAMYNTINWPVRRYVEIVSDAWWNNAFLMLIDARGVTDYTIIRGDLGEDHVTAMLDAVFAAPLDAPGSA